MGQINVTKCPIEGLYIIEPTVHGDSRGYFMETYNRADLAEIGINCDFIQDNESKSSYGVLRGLHYQKGEFSQAKLVRVIKGKVIDVAVDLRKSSETFGQYVAVELSEENKRQLFIPRGFAHGFLVLSEEAVFTYKVDNVYAPQADAGIIYNDPQIGIKWDIEADKVFCLALFTAPFCKTVSSAWLWLIPIGIADAVVFE